MVTNKAVTWWNGAKMWHVYTKKVVSFDILLIKKKCNFCNKYLYLAILWKINSINILLLLALIDTIKNL